MALTTQEEAAVRLLLASAANGKAVSDLPTADTSTLLAAYMEVIQSGTSKKALVQDIIPILTETSSYGIKIHIATGVVTRIGNGILHASLPIQSRMKGCLLSDAGAVLEYLPATSWAGVDRSGESGQVMVEIPDHYRKTWTDGVYIYILISEYPLAGFTYIPKHYVGAYQAAWQASTGKLCSVVNATTDYRGGNGTDWDGTYRTLLGRPRTYMRRYEYKDAARLRNASATTEWNVWAYHSYVALVWMMCIEYGTLNMQTAYNANLDANGYKQGGLGAGVSNINIGAWNTFNSYNPFVPCGYTDALGNGSGEVAFTMPAEYGTLTTYVNRYRGIEMPFGHIWQWLDGINIEVKTDAEGGTSKVYVCDDPSKFTDTDYTDYQMRGLAARSGGYVKEIIFGEQGDIIPKSVGAGSDSFYCDYFYTVITSSVLQGVMVGGDALRDAYAGTFCVTSDYTPLYRNANTGARLCFITS